MLEQPWSPPPSKLRIPHLLLEVILLPVSSIGLLPFLRKLQFSLTSTPNQFCQDSGNSSFSPDPGAGATWRFFSKKRRGFDE